MESVINLYENCYEVCPFYFKGDIKEIERLKKEFKIKEEGEIVSLFLDSKELIDVVSRYSSLMIMGFVEEWDFIHKVYVVFSSKGSSVFDKCEFAGYFDGHDEDRWNWRYVPYEDIHDSFLVLSCGEYEDIDYSCPFIDEWNS